MFNHNDYTYVLNTKIYLATSAKYDTYRLIVANQHDRPLREFLLEKRGPHPDVEYSESIVISKSIIYVPTVLTDTT